MQGLDGGIARAGGDAFEQRGVGILDVGNGDTDVDVLTQDLLQLPQHIVQMALWGNGNVNIATSTYMCIVSLIVPDT